MYTKEKKKEGEEEKEEMTQRWREENRLVTLGHEEQ